MKKTTNDATINAGHLIEPPKAGGVFPWLAQRIGLAKLVNLANAILNGTDTTTVIFPDGTKQSFTAQITFSNATAAASRVLDLSQSNLGSGGGGSGTVPFSGAGAPSATTLLLTGAASYSAVQPVSIYIDTTNKVWYYCTTTGSNATSVWAQIGDGTIAAGNYGGTYNNGNAYKNGTIVRVQSATVYNGVAATIGVFGCVVDCPAGGTGNQIPQFPEPTTGTIYWQLISLGVQVISTCQNGSVSTYIQASQSF